MATTKEKVMYDAFISYRHADLDKFVAETLHKQLEAFRLPKSVAKRRLKGEKTRIRRVFRDKDELPIASDLASPIVTALENSEFLIVICSPRTPESIWVEREISTFISLHGRDHVLAVLIEGEPCDAFPPELLEADREITLSDGTKTVEKIPVEPLAADVRGKNKREVGKNIRQELLRLAAPMFECGYDDLKQRHKEQKIKRTMRFLLASCAFFFCFGGYSYYQAFRIQKQSEQIQAQSVEIKAKSDEIKKQYDEILVTNLNSLGDESLRLLEEGDRIESIHVAKSALPKSSTDDSLPLVTKAEYALSEALYVYQNESDMLPDRMFKHDTNVEFMKLSPSEKRMMTVDSSNTVSVFDTASGELISSFLADDADYYSPEENEFAFVTESEIVYMGNTTLRRYNFETKETIWTSEDIYPSEITYSSDFRYAAVSDSSVICLYDLADGTIPIFYSSDEEVNQEESHPFDVAIFDPAADTLGSLMCFNSDSSLLSFTNTNWSDDSVGEVLTMDLNQKQIISVIKPELPNIMSLLYTDNETLAIAANTPYDTKNVTKDNLFGKSGFGDVLLYHISDSTLLWSQRIDGSYLRNLKLTNSEVTYLGVQGHDCLYSLLLEDGTLMGEASFGSGIIDYIPYPTNSYVLCMLRNGSAESVDLNGGYVYNPLFQAASQDVKSIIRGNGRYFILPFDARQIVSYCYPKNPGKEEVMPLDDSIDIVMNSNDSAFILKKYTDDSKIAVYDNKTKNLLFEHSCGDYMPPCLFVGDQNQFIAICLNEEVVFLDSSDGKEIKSISCEDMGSIEKVIYHEGSHSLFVFHYDGISVLDTNTPAMTKQYELPDVFSSLSAACGTDGSSYIIANKESDSLELYDFDATKVKKSISVNADYIVDLFYNEDQSLLFAAYKNNQVEVYAADTLTLLATYDQFNGAVNRCVTLTNGSGDYVLANDYHGFLCTASHEQKAYFPYLKAIDRANNRLFGYSYNELFTLPIYSLDMLLDVANRI